jgi:hypothetical protein
MPPQAPGHVVVYLVPVIAVIMIVLRNARERRLRVERLWVAPLVFVLLTGLILAAQSPPGLEVIAIEGAALALGAAARWWRGRLTRITVDPETHLLTTKTSALGMVVIFGLFATRFALRSLSGEAGRWLHVPALHVTDTLLLLALGLVCAQRLEIALRATRLLRDARGARRGRVS